ncbi:MAG: hypothetical protein IKY41_07375 [Clostridia bacterium]|nr:hypothetical protein [Clostridia bacterium]
MDKTVIGKTVLVWITNPAACEIIVKTGKKIAEELNAELMVASIQQKIRDNWETTVSDLEALNKASRNANAELTVIYSDNTFEAAVKTVREVQPIAMVTGVPGNLRKNLFIEQLQNFDKDVPIYTIDSRGNALKLSQNT